MNRHFVFLLIISVGFSACLENASIDKSKNDEKIPSVKKEVLTFMDSEPQIMDHNLRIGNDKHFMRITSAYAVGETDSTRKCHHFELIKTRDSVSVLSKYIDKKILMDSCIINPNSQVHFKDSLNQDFIADCYLDSIAYHGIRGNTIMFDIWLRNPTRKKTNTYMLQMFYRNMKNSVRTGYKGEFYSFLQMDNLRY